MKVRIAVIFSSYAIVFGLEWGKSRQSPIVTISW